MRGQTPNGYINRLRIVGAVELLELIKGEGVILRGVKVISGWLHDGLKRLLLFWL